MMVRYAAAVLVLAVLGACAAPFTVVAPAGFATFVDTDDVRAVSADGVLFRVRSEVNEPEASLEFWREALHKRMDDAGYLLMGDEEITAGNEPGYLLKLAAPMGSVDYSYVVAIFVHGEAIIIAEATGPANLLAKHDAALRQAFAEIEFL